MWLTIATRLFKQEIRRGELTIMLIAVALAVLSVYSLAAFSDRIKSALEYKSSTFLAADRVIQSAHPIDDNLLDTPLTAELQQAQLLYFQSMLYRADDALLSNIKAVQGDYPLRGELILLDDAGQQMLNQGPPNPGEAWVDKRLLPAMSLNYGDEVEIGMAKFVVSRAIDDEPETSFSLFNSGPRVIINMADVEATGVVRPGSRLSYRYLFAGKRDDIDAYSEWVKPQLKPNQEWRDIHSDNSPISGALERAERFLLLASLLGILLAATAVAVASRRYSERQYDTVAVLKTLGASSRQIRRIFLSHLLLTTGMAIIIGLVIGYGLQLIGISLLSEYLPKDIPAAGWEPLVLATVTGLICALLFSFGPMLGLIKVPPLRVIRRDLAVPGLSALMQSALIAVTVFTLLLLYSRDVVMSLSLLGSAALAVGCIMLVSRLLIYFGRHSHNRSGHPLAIAIAGLQRRSKQSSVQMISFTVAIMLLLIIVLLQNELVEEWQNQLPEDAPNHFLINVADYEVDDIRQLLDDNAVVTTDLYPVIRGRMTAVNNEEVRTRVSKEEEQESEQGRRGVGRELNLTWRESIPPNNAVVEGSWWTTAEAKEVSVENRLAERLNIQLGDELRFLIGGVEVEAKVTSIREADWNSMQPNFFMIFSPGVLQNYPTTYISAFHLTEQQQPLINTLLKRHPTITVLDVGRLIDQVQSVITQVSQALKYIMVLVVVASALVLIAQVQASFDDRKKEMVTLRTLGASSAFLRQSLLAEFLLLGAISGFIASWATEVALYFIQSRVFNMDWQPHFSMWIIAAVVGAVFVGLLGRMSCQRLLNTSATDLMRSLG